MRIRTSCPSPAPPRAANSASDCAWRSNNSGAEFDAETQRREGFSVVLRVSLSNPSPSWAYHRQKGQSMPDFDRRDFFKTAGLTGIALAPQTAGARPLTEKEKLARIASNTWPLRYLFKSRTGFGRNPTAVEMKK